MKQEEKEINWDKIYATEEWRELKWEMGQIFSQYIQVDDNGNIEGNPAIHRMAQYAWQLKSLPSNAVREALEELNKVLDFMWNRPLHARYSEDMIKRICAAQQKCRVALLSSALSTGKEEEKLK